MEEVEELEEAPVTPFVVIRLYAGREGHNPWFYATVAVTRGEGGDETFVLTTAGMRNHKQARHALARLRAEAVRALRATDIHPLWVR